ncbi:hypothetical protein BU26DRAFT_521498 [Trematosphaeria pertusa]|uniref:DUF4048 domain-containing protein n=1 Tax=Trematosphaeria pertusa TaxID=390896 RepID=A0A6A6I6L8_9PLEO|nr:uncharacterized protein BU26DRAFT_521498 [Trematosphaeria pertusa]KAF2245976.1 hypothetical protein BU26DRAFT_521498 [Trematosphaeria pertusa]
MGSSAGPTLLKAWLSFLLRLLGVPAALLALHLELHGSSPASTSLILHRLSRRLRLSALACMLKKDHDTGMNSIFFVGGADVMDRAQSQHKPQPLARKRSMTLDDKDRTRPGGSPTLQNHLPRQPSGASDASSTSSTLSHPSPNPSMPSHSRSPSHADIVRQGKRLSLQFPIQPVAGSNSLAFSPRSRPQSWVAAPSPVPSPDATSSSSETNILAVLAAQERYVLELKEELAKAEQDLKTLKKHFATQEAIKQRNEVRKVTQLQPLNTTLANYDADQDDEDGSSLWMQREMERRKTLLSGHKTSQRKVFSGSRHLRTLSLLSPDKSYSPSFPQPLDVREDEPIKPRPAPLSRNATSPDIANQIARTVSGERYDLGGLSNIQRDALLRTGKQMATDFKDGLLTFIEDIRQATVGEEAVADGSGPGATRGPAAKGARKPSDGRPNLNRAATSKNSAASKSGDIGNDFWKEHGLSEPKTAPTNKKTHALKHTRTPQKPTHGADDFEDWDSWDTPNDKYTNAAKAGDAHNSSDESDGPSSPVSGQASSRTSTRYHSQRHDSKASSLTMSSSADPRDDAAPRDSKRNSIPWPDLVKLSPTNLKRTASHLMKEWEKNLTPPPESRDASHSSGDYVGRSVTPAGQS